MLPHQLGDASLRELAFDVGVAYTARAAAARRVRAVLADHVNDQDFGGAVIADLVMLLLERI